jgi:ssRNA-specific RNase YbeY (16S rRNA maturation enzyme)
MVSYFTEDIVFPFKEKRLTSRWLKFVAESEAKRLGDVAIIFCSDNYILDVNIKVKGEDHTNDTNVSPKDRTQKEYIVTIKMGGIMANLQRELDSNTAINSRQIIRALVKSFNGEDIYVRCSCPD